MAIIDTNQVTILDAILQELRLSLGLNESTCFEVADPEEMPPLPPGGDYFLTVAWEDSDYNPDEQTASTVSPGHILEFSRVAVTINTRPKLDRAGHDQKLLVEEKRGLLAIKPRVIGALAGKDLTDDEGNSLLRDILFVEHAGRAQVYVRQADSSVVGRLSITFGVHFDLAVE